MPITIPNFTTTAVITGNTLISQADEQFNIMMNDIKTYIQNVYGSVSSSLEDEVRAALEQVEDIYDEFNDIYLGAKATDPLLDNDGNALIIGAMYFNSTSGVLKTYSGSGWITQLTLDVYTKSEVQNSLPSIGLNTTLNNTPNIGQITWNQDDFTANLGMPFGVVQQIGEEFFFPVKNQTGSTILNGRPVMAIDTTGNSGNLLISYHNGLQAYAKNTIGVATHDIPNGANGLITVIGRVRNLDTTGSAFGETWADNDVLYIKPNSNGMLTNVEPQDTQLKMPIANVIHAHTNGTLLVRTTPIDENHDKALIDSKVARNPDITAGTATKVTYDAKGLVTSGTNPTTISGYGITDAMTKVISTDNAVVRFNGTTGEVQNSGVIIDDVGNVGIGRASSNTNTIIKELLIQSQDDTGVARTRYQNSLSTVQFDIGYSNYLNENIGFIGTQTNSAVTIKTNGTERMRIASSGNLLVGTTTDNGVDKLRVNGSITIKPLASATPANNGELTFEATSNTSVKIKLKGSDGVVRSATLTLV